MKKNLFIAALCAVATLSITSCDPKKDDADTDLTVEITPSVLTVGIGAESEKLTVKITPAGNNQTIVWSSSDEAVATVKGGYVTGVAEGKATITATVGTAKGTCEVTVANDAALDNYAIGGWGFFGHTIDYIEGTDTTLTFSDGSTYKCQLGVVSLYVWDNNLTFVNGKGFSGEGYIAFSKIALYWIIEGEDAGNYIGNSSGYFVDSIAGNYGAYTAKRGELADLNKYGTYFQQYAAYLKDTTQNLDNDLYEDALTGTQLCIFYADDNEQSWYVGNVKYAQLYQDANKNYLYDATIEWFDFYSSNRWFGLEASYVDNSLDKIVEPFDMRTVEKSYTNIEATDEAAVKSEQKTEWVLGDMSRVHPATNIRENAIRNTMNLYFKK